MPSAARSTTWSTRSATPASRATKLAWWRTEVAQAFAGQPHHPVMQALMPHAAAYGIEERQLQEVIDGCQMDLDQTRYLDFPALQRYCHLVAGVVGEGAARIFGQTDAADHRLRPQAGPGAAAHQHHPRRRRRRAARAHLPAGQRAAAVRREGARDPQPRALRALRRADEVPGRARACGLRRGAGAAAGGRPARAEARA